MQLISQAPALTQVVIRTSSLVGPEAAVKAWGAADMQQYQGAMCSVLQLLPKLWVLDLQGTRLGDAAAQHIATMTKLQQLQVRR